MESRFPTRSDWKSKAREPEGVGAQLRVETFDKLSAAGICLSLGFSLGVALASWKWFPTEGDWGHIAEIPPGYLNYTALLLPWVATLLYLLVRRLVFRRPF